MITLDSFSYSQKLVASGRVEGPGECHPVHAAITYLQTLYGDLDWMNYAPA